EVKSWPTRLKTAMTRVMIITVLNKGGAKIRINTDVKGLKDVFEKKVLRKKVNTNFKENIDQFLVVIKSIVRMKELEVILTYNEEMMRKDQTLKWKMDIQGEKILLQIYFT